MLTFPISKINLGLQILDKRSDGYHNIASIFYPIGLTDALEIVEASAKQKAPVLISYSGLPIPNTGELNLCEKAYHLLKKDFNHLPKVQMHLHKKIPMGAGLGGGSADGAFALQMLNSLFQLSITEEQLKNYALQLGSDCPFFINPKPAMALGRGELLQPISLNLSAYRLLLIYPGIHINTAQAFANLPAVFQKENNLIEIIQAPITQWKNRLTNDFEINAFKNHPELQGLKQNLYEQGALYAAMSGSGSCMYGLFQQKIPQRISPLKSYFEVWL